MNTEELYEKYKDKICILHINSIGERELAWFKKKSEALDFQESGITVVYMLDLKFAKDNINQNFTEHTIRKIITFKNFKLKRTSKKDKNRDKP